VDDPIFDGEMPGAEQLRDQLERWRSGAADRDDLREWAEAIVDAVVLPDPVPAAPGGALAEVILQLASSLPLTVADVDPLLALVEADADDPREAWAAWWSHVRGVDWRRRA
jgi:hypothetical protein